MSSEELDLTNDDDSRYAEFFGPGIVKMVASPDTTTKIDPRLFPISEQGISDMPNYLDKINNIIIGGELNAISPEKLKQIQALIRGSNSPEEINQIEMILKLNEKVWIHFYMKWLRREQELSGFDDFWSPEHTESPLSDETVKRMTEKVIGQLNQANVILGKFRKP